MKIKWLLFALPAITGLTASAQELKRGDFMSRNEEQQQTLQNERIQAKTELLIPTLQEKLLKKDYQAIRSAASRKLADAQAQIRYLGKMEALIATAFLEPEQAHAAIQQILSDKSTPEFPDWIYLMQNCADLMPKPIVCQTMESLEKSGLTYYHELAQICYRNGETRRALNYLDQYISWVEEGILHQTAHLNDVELLRQQMIR